MAGHNKWAQIKRQKGKTDKEKSKAFSKFSRLITTEAKRVGGDRNSASLIAIIDRARAINMPNDSIDRAVKKSTENSAAMESAVYEAYGPGGSALIIDSLTDNKNKAAQEIKHILSRNGYSLAGMGAASWAFEKTAEGWIPKSTMELSDEDVAKLDTLITELEENDDVQAVYTNAE
jgi:transcriptional/translational regulatory protein YebC/TACO1